MGPVVYITSGELEPRGGLTLFGGTVDQPLRSVSVTRGGEITGFPTRGGAVKTETDGVAFTAHAMTRGMRLDPESKDYTDPYKKYIRFECAGIEPLRIDGASRVTFTGGEETVIPYEEGNISVEGKADEELFAELLRETLWRNHNKTDK
jgi:hypothetical protein